MSWDANRPRDRDNLKDLAELWRSDKSFLQNYLESFVSWQGANAGKLLGGGVIGTSRSSDTVSGAVALVVPRSQVSYRRDGDLFLVSDESRFVISRSDQTVPLFSDKAVVHYHNNTDGSNQSHSINTDSRVMVTMGTGTCSDDADATISYGVTYGAIPSVCAAQSSSDNGSTASFMLGIHTVTTTNFKVWAHYAGPGAASGNKCRILWRSSGTTGVTL